MNSLLCVALSFLCVGTLLAKRPDIGETDGSRIAIVDLDLSIQPPKGWEMQGARELEAENYRFPWFVTDKGLLQFALVDVKLRYDSVSDGVLAHLEKTKFTQKGHAKILHLDNDKESVRNVLVRIGFTNGVVRYYFRNAVGYVGFIHFVGASPEVVEKILLETAQF